MGIQRRHEVEGRGLIRDEVADGREVKLFVVLLFAHKKKNVLTIWHGHFDEG